MVGRLGLMACLFLFKHVEMYDCDLNNIFSVDTSEIFSDCIYSYYIVKIQINMI